MPDVVRVAGQQIPVEPRRVLAALVVADVLFLALHLFSQWMRFRGEEVFATTFEGAELFDLDREVSIATWWQQTQLTAAGLLALLLGYLDRRAGGSEGRLWTGLGCILIYIAIDDGSEVHERFTEPLRQLFDVEGGIFWYAWLIPAIALLAVFGLVYFRFWRRRTKRVRTLMAIAGIVYLGGGIGGEMLSGAYDSQYGKDYGYTFFTALEEVSEMLGISVFVMALLVALVAAAERSARTGRMRA